MTPHGHRSWGSAIVFRDDTVFSEQIVPDVLRVLANAGVPGYAAPAHSAGWRLRGRSRRPETYRVWVGASAHGRAEEVLVAVMPRLARDAARRADSAWR